MLGLLVKVQKRELFDSSKFISPFFITFRIDFVSCFAYCNTTLLCDDNLYFIHFCSDQQTVYMKILGSINDLNFWFGTLNKVLTGYVDDDYLIQKSKDTFLMKITINI